MSVFSLLLASGAYQPTVSYYILFSMIFLIGRYLDNINSKIAIKVFFKEYFKALFIAGITVLFNVFFFKYIVVNNARTQVNQTDFVDNILKIINLQSSVFLNSYNLLPRYMILFFTIVLLALIVCLGIKYYQFKRIQVGIVLLIALVTGWGAIFGIMIIAPVFWPTPRVIISFMAIPGLLTMVCLLLMDRSDNITINQRYFSKLMLGILSIFLIMSIVRIQIIGNGLLKVNTLDQYIVQSIYEDIIDYEKQSGIRVEKIGIVKAKNVRYTYPGVVSCFDLNVRAIIVDWAMPDIFRYVTKRSFSFIGEDQIPKNLEFIPLNRETISTQQIVFQNNKAYILIR